MSGTAPKAAIALCWVAIGCGAALLVAGLYTGYAEGVRADANGTVGRVMPAEVAAVILGPILIAAGVVAARIIRRAPGGAEGGRTRRRAR